jgi:acyl-CoA reductase-like NAD-dependent aldehyde dehydrogenase
MNIAISKPKLGKDSKAFLAKKHHMLIGGKWLEAKSGKTFEVEDPATQEVIAHVPAGDKADIELAVAAARKAFDDDDLDQVAKFANDTEYGLQASIWTHNLKVAHSLARKIKAGTICANAHNYGDPAWPFGGFKQSGWGREMGKEVMEHYTETKSVAINLV